MRIYIYNCSLINENKIIKKINNNSLYYDAYSVHYLQTLMLSLKILYWKKSTMSQNNTKLEKGESGQLLFCTVGVKCIYLPEKVTTMYIMLKLNSMLMIIAYTKHDSERKRYVSLYYIPSIFYDIYLNYLKCL